MATETLACAATASPDNWTLGAGSTKVAAVAFTGDGDSTYIYSDVHATQQGFTLATHSIPTGSTGLSVGVRMTIKKMALALSRIFISLQLPSVSDTVVGPIDLTDSPYISYSELFQGSIARPGGGSWALSDLTNLTVVLTSNQNTEIRITDLRVEVEYTPPPGQPAIRRFSHFPLTRRPVHENVRIA